jgi:hypothetical protein
MGCILWGRGHSLLLLALVALGGTALEGLAGKTGKYCQPDGRNIVLAIDTTTPYDDQDKDQLVRGVGEIVGEMQGGDRLAIRTITGSHIHSDHVFDRCRPGCAETSIWGSLLYCAEGMIQADDQKMKAEITHALRSRLANFIEQPRSDIIHTLVNASREEIQPGRNTELYIFSDLIENSDHMSTHTMLSIGPNVLLSRLKKFGLIAALEGVEVRVFGAGRDSSPARNLLPVPTLQKVLLFWTAYFKASGSSFTEISPNLIPPPFSTSSPRD